MSYIKQCEPTPNPNSYKWIVSYDFAADDMYEYTSADDAQKSVLAAAIWALNDVHQRIMRIFFHDNMIVIHKTDDAIWDDLVDGISKIIDANMNACFSVAGARKEWSDDEKMIIEVIDDYIQPAIQGHGGLIKFHRFNDGIVYVSLHGACNGCDSSDTTLYNGVENILKFYVPGVVAVKIAD